MLYSIGRWRARANVLRHFNKITMELEFCARARVPGSGVCVCVCVVTNIVAVPAADS